MPDLEHLCFVEVTPCGYLMEGSSMKDLMQPL
jgi:hypothetical protein